MNYTKKKLGMIEGGEKPAVMNIYDMEPHLQRDTDIPRHNRFYQAKIDSRGLRSGEKDFSKLPNLYVLMILNVDPFGKDRMIYTIRNRCEEEPELEYEDGLRFYYFYTGGTYGGNEALKAMLTYMQDSRAENAIDQTTAKLHNYVSRAKISPEVRDAYMRWEEIIYYERKEEREKKRLKEIRDKEILRKWHKLAAKVNSIEEFEKEIQLV